ncbi:acyl-CoA-binding domain-containing protein 4 isoform X2 [Rhineura floridana]|nr:acyl-CoA-binding domain-containing protein 4 isoform X2 [Rhineura floridana]XP_061447109.1 acyl-CoA-binding domain-containing protein 4 isoform X2 [Rhineura floridana]XP_061447110.1 acyl-CoA-binding domain-containing protein 4 isoform X2 [Rhineura floridana]
MRMKEEEPDYQKQFEAAVNVIQGLPKNGSYRPSYEEMLRFYSYYKQATVGQCQIPRPGFWDPIGRYKWDAWNSLGKMTKKEAMAAYIAEMKKAAQKVINTVPLDEASEDMFVYFEPLYEVIHDMPRHPKSFFKKKPGHVDKAIKNSQVTSDSESEVFCDSLEHVEPDQVRRLSATQSLPLNNSQRVKAEEESVYKPPAHAPSSRREGKPNKALQTSPIERGLNSSLELTNESQAGAMMQQEVELQVMSTIQALQEDMKKVLERLGYLESQAVLQGHTSMLNPCQLSLLHDGKELPGWPAQLSPRTWFFLLAWPFIVQWLLWYFQRQKR